MNTRCYKLCNSPSKVVMDTISIIILTEVLNMWKFFLHWQVTKPTWSWVSLDDGKDLLNNGNTFWWFILHRCKQIVAIFVRCFECCSFKLIAKLFVWSFKIDCKADLMHRQKSLPTSELAKNKTKLEIVKMIYRRHWTVKDFIADLWWCWC